MYLRNQVTTDPRSKIPIHEGVGTVTSDSLAAESLRGDGHFGEGNPKAAASAQSSTGSTATNTDTSGARKLDAAIDAEARDAASGWSEQQQLSAGAGLGLGKEHGVSPTYNKVGGATGYGTSTQPPSSNVEEIQGGYAGAGDKIREAEGAFNMPGKNVTEDPNLTGKSEFGPIGTKKDPARVAEFDQARKNAASGVLVWQADRMKAASSAGCVMRLLDSIAFHLTSFVLIVFESQHHVRLNLKGEIK